MAQEAGWLDDISIENDNWIDDVNIEFDQPEEKLDSTLAERAGDGVGIGDIGRAVGSGVFTGLSAWGDISERIFGVGEDFRDWAKLEARVLDQGMSEDAKRSMQKNLFESEGWDISFGEGAGDLSTWGLKFANTLGLQADMLIPGLGLAKAGKKILGVGSKAAQAKMLEAKAAALIARGTNAKVAKKIVEKDIRLRLSAAAMTGFGTAEAAVAAGATAMDVEDQIMEMDQNILNESPEYQALLEKYDEQEARGKLAKRASNAAAYKVALPTFLFGAVAGKVYDDILRNVGGMGFKTAVAKGAATEALEEAPQSAAEHFLGQTELQRADPTVEPTRGLVASAMEGMALGGGVGGVTGAGLHAAGARESEFPTPVAEGDPREEAPTADFKPTHTVDETPVMQVTEGGVPVPGLYVDQAGGRIEAENAVPMPINPADVLGEQAQPAAPDTRAPWEKLPSGKVEGAIPGIDVPIEPEQGPMLPADGPQPEPKGIIQNVMPEAFNVGTPPTAPAPEFEPTHIMQDGTPVAPVLDDTGNPIAGEWVDANGEAIEEEIDLEPIVSFAGQEEDIGTPLTEVGEDIPADEMTDEDYDDLLDGQYGYVETVLEPGESVPVEVEEVKVSPITEVSKEEIKVERIPDEEILPAKEKYTGEDRRDTDRREVKKLVAKSAEQRKEDRREAAPVEEVEAPATVVRKTGEPYKTLKSAQMALKARKDVDLTGYTATPVEGGYALTKEITEPTTKEVPITTELVEEKEPIEKPKVKKQPKPAAETDSDIIKAAVSDYKTKDEVISYLRGRLGKKKVKALQSEIDSHYEAEVSPEEINDAAQEAAESPENDIPLPSDEQKAAGNYKVGKITINGLEISIENPAGSERTGTDSDGETWSQTMKSHYGYFRGKDEGADGDAVDVFLTDNSGDPELPVFVIDQVDPKTGAFDEGKVVMGTENEAAARKAYLDNYEKGWKGIGGIKQYTLDEFKTWLDGDTTKPVTELAAVKKPAIEEVEPDVKSEFIGINKGFIADRKKEGIDIESAGDYVTLYHGTSKSSANKITKEGIIKGFPFFAFDKKTAERFGRQAITRGKPEILEMKVYMGDILPTGGYFSAQSESLSRNDDGTWSAKPIAKPVAEKVEPEVPVKPAEPVEKEISIVTETPEFKRWFGESKVVDEDGKPLVVYHGSPVEIEEFDKDSVGTNFYIGDTGFFFAEDYSDAAAYGKFNVVEAYLNIEKPYYVDAKGENGQGVFDEGQDDYFKEAKEESADGIIIRNTEGDGRNIYIAFKSEQIKSTDNIGDFDPTDPRILYSRESIVQPGEKPKGMTVDQVQSVVDDFQNHYKGAQRLNFVVKDTQVEATGKEIEVDEDGNEFLIKADFYRDTRTIVFVSENMDNAMDVLKTLRHEVVAHYGLPALIGEVEYNKLLDDVLEVRDSTLRDLFIETEENYPDVDEYTLAEEVLARVSEKRLRTPLIKRIIAKIIKMLRAIGMYWKPISISEIEALLYESAKRLRVEVEPVGELLQRGEPFVEATERAEPLHARKRVMGTAEQEAAMANTIAVPDEELSLRQRLSNMFKGIKTLDGTKFRQGLIDEFASVEAMEKEKYGDVRDASMSPSKAARRTKNLDSVMAAIMISGPLKYQGGTFQVDPESTGFNEIFEELSKKGLLPLWEAWAAATRANRLMAEGKEHNFTQEQIDELLPLAEQHLGENGENIFQKAMDEYQEFNKGILDMAESVGVIDPEARKLWERNDYVPFYRAMEDILGDEIDVKAPRVKGGLSGQRAGIKQLKGGEDKIGNVLENMMLNASHLVDVSFKTVAMRRIVDMAEGVAMEKVEDSFTPEDISQGAMTDALQRANILPEGVNASSLSNEEREQYMKLLRKSASGGKRTVSVLTNGKPEYYRVYDDLLLRAITSMGVRNVEGMMKVMRGAKRVLTQMITADPAFMLANFLRDTMSTSVVSHVGLTPGVDAVKGFIAATKEDPALLSIMAGGGGGGGYYHATPTETRKRMHYEMNAMRDKNFRESILNTPKKLWNSWQKVGAASENANRIAIQKAVLARGGTVAEATHQAQDILNFTQSGDFAVMRFLIETVPFMNARIQGLDRLYRGYKEDPKGFALKGLMLTAASMALMAINGDEDEYDELPEWDKDTYWHFFLGDKDKKGRSEYHYRLPKPFEVGAIFGTIPERLTRYIAGEDSGKLLATRAGHMVLDTFAMNPLPQLFKPMAEQYADRNFFTGSPIVGMGMKRMKPEAQYKPWTSETMRELAELMPDFAPAWLRSPKRLEAALRGYTGTMGMYALQTADMITRRAAGYAEPPKARLDDLPVIKRFARGTPPRSTKYGDLFYSMMQDANELYSTIKQYRQEGRLKEAKELAREGKGKLGARKQLNKISRKITAINSRIKLTYSSRKLSPEQKRVKVDKLIDNRDTLLRQAAKYEDRF